MKKFTGEKGLFSVVRKNCLRLSLQCPNFVAVSIRLWQTRPTQEIKPKSWIQKCFSSQMPFDLFYQTFCSIWIWSKLHNQGKWPGKHLEQAERKSEPRADPGFSVWVTVGLSLPWRQMLGTSWEGTRPLSGREGPPTAFWFSRTSGNPTQSLSFPLQSLLHSTN